MRRLLGGALAVAVLLSLGGAVCILLGTRYERGTHAGYGSSLRSDADGTRALFLLLEETGHRPGRLTSPVPPPGSLLLSVEPVATPKDFNDLLLSWIEEGGILILAGSARSTTSPVGLFRHFEMQQESLAGRLGLSAVEGSARARRAGPLLEESSLEALDDATASQRWAALPVEGRVLLGTPMMPVLVEIQRGRGRVVALSDASWFENAGVTEGARLPLALHLLLGPDRPVFFDEFRHGIAEQPGLAYVLQRYGLIPSAFAAFLLLAMVAWRTTPRESASADPEGGEGAPALLRDSLIEARAGLYGQVLNPVEVLARLEEELRAGAGLAGRRRGKVGSPDRVKERQALEGELVQARRSAPARLKGVLPLAKRIATYLEEDR